LQNFKFVISIDFLFFVSFLIGTYLEKGIGKPKGSYGIYEKNPREKGIREGYKFILITQQYQDTWEDGTKKSL
jgi:hypothetical protein